MPVEAGPDELAERLTLAGLAVEEVLVTGREVEGVVVGEVRAIREHPAADNLVLVRAFDGGAEHDVVCGARNYAVGDRVPLALPGARLPGGIEIGRRVVRGETSDGMLCSARELRVADDHAGILILDRNAPLGKDVVAALELDDVILDIDVTPNRPDCLSIVGVAREVAVLYGLPFTVPPPVVAEGDRDAAALVRVSVEDVRGCPRYLARVITGVALGPSPWWMRRRIMATGMRPISNVVDVTNYVLLERGHPLHAFDRSKLAGSSIVVRRPKRGERIVTLDGQERVPGREDVLICDAERPVAVAGVMGGADSEVSESTTEIVLESAYFDPVRVGRAARRLGLRTEASVRFERGADPEAVPAAADRAAELLASVAGGTVARGAVDVYPRPRRARAIRLRVPRANALIGNGQPAEEMAASLRALGCTVEASRTALRVFPPSHRPDLVREEDLIEEIARLYGYDRVPETLPTGARAGGLTPAQRRRRVARALLLGAGLSEAQTLSLLPPWFPDRLGLPEEHPWRATVRLANPLSEEESVLRPSLVPGLLLVALRNEARRLLPVRLFEAGTTFAPGDGGVREAGRVAWVLTGPAPGGWHQPERSLDFFDAKGVLEALVEGLGLGSPVVKAAGEGDAVFARGLFHPGRSATVTVDGARVGFLAELHPRTAAALELAHRVVVAELDLDALTARSRESVAPVLPRFPAVARDLALVVPEEVPAAAAVQEVVRAAGGSLLESVALFDVYRGEQIPAGMVSLAFALSFRDPERTLTDEDADAALGAIVEAARSRGWSVRE